MSQKTVLSHDISAPGGCPACNHIFKIAPALFRPPSAIDERLVKAAIRVLNDGGDPRIGPEIVSRLFGYVRLRLPEKAWVAVSAEAIAELETAVLKRSS